MEYRGMKTAVKEENLCRRKQMGQSVVELALITPLTLIALYIPADFGMAFLTAHLTQNAVREGARIGSGLTSGNPDNPISGSQGTTIKDAVLTRLPEGLSSPSVNVKFYFAGEAPTCMQVVEVTATGTYDYGIYRLMRLIGVTVPPSAPISRTTQMRYNYQRPENNTPTCVATGFEQTYSS
jgi:Flp pilus assembly protein TadG